MAKLKQRKHPRDQLSYWRMNDKEILYQRLIDTLKSHRSMDPKDKVYILNLIRHKVLEGKV